ncbi:unnamed protein product [Mytilus coruscus]|uniref:Ig-like domain-containing protein n=1 Tax=Mytilus coruscus TaxID=42192 RepID=A0A6J8EZK1_MYTCO|nr:unnamed protein product [Mytilus coruscus]
MVMFICTGNIGSSPEKLIWQKTFPREKKPVTYSNETTDIEKIPGKCSFKGSSHLTVKIYAEDIKAKIRCFEESQVNVPGMYLETEPFDVHFQVNHVDINKQPNQKQYDTKTDSITLTCKGIGNPQPTYVWFKEGKYNSILSNKSFYVIENIIRNNSGVYICEVNNIIDDINYRKSNSVEINIVYVIPVICVVLFIVICAAIIKLCYIRPKRKENEENYYQTLSHDVMTVNPEYASVIYTNNTSVGEAGDNVVCNNGKEGNKNRNNVSDRTVIYDEVNQQANLNFESSKNDKPVLNNNSGFDVSTESSMNDGEKLQTGDLTCKEVTDDTSVQDPNNYEDLIASDRTAVYVYDVINQQTTLKYKVPKARVSVSTDNID